MAGTSSPVNGKRLRPAVFFDRDGTLNEEVGFLSEVEHFHLYPFAGQAVREVNEAGLLAIVVTNQSGIGHGYLTEKVLADIHEQLEQQISAGGGWLDGIFYCPHHPDAPLDEYRRDCDCRKPEPGMAEEAAARFGIDLQESFVVGDRHVDVELAHRIGARSVLVLTGMGRDEWQAHGPKWPCQPHYVAEDVSDAVRWILKHASQQSK